MISADWGVGYAKTLGAFLNGSAITERDRAGVRITDDSFFLMFNSYQRADGIQAAAEEMWARNWTIVLDTADATAGDRAQSHPFEERVHVAGHAMVVLRRVA